MESSKCIQKINEQEAFFTESNSEVLENPTTDSTGNVTSESLRKTKKKATNRSSQSNLHTETCFQVIFVKINFYEIPQCKILQ